VPEIRTGNGYIQTRAVRLDGYRTRPTEEKGT
jgi:hypothetical protein